MCPRPSPSAVGLVERLQCCPADAVRACARCSRVWRAATAAKSTVGRERPPAGPNGALRSSSSSLRPRSSVSSRAPFCSSSATVSAGPTPAARQSVLGVGPVDLVGRLRHARAAGHPLEPTQAVGVTLRDVVQHHADGPVLAGYPLHPGSGTAAPGEADGVGIGRREVVGQSRRPFTRQGAPRPARSVPRWARHRGACPRPRRAPPVAAARHSPAWAHRGAPRATRSHR